MFPISNRAEKKDRSFCSSSGRLSFEEDCGEEFLSSYKKASPSLLLSQRDSKEAEEERDRKGEEREEGGGKSLDATYSEKNLLSPSEEKGLSRTSEGGCMYTRQIERECPFVQGADSVGCRISEERSKTSGPEHPSESPTSRPSLSPFPPVIRRFSQRYRKGKTMLRGYKELHEALKVREFLLLDKGAGRESSEDSTQHDSEFLGRYDSSPFSSRGKVSTETTDKSQGLDSLSGCMYTASSPSRLGCSTEKSASGGEEEMAVLPINGKTRGRQGEAEMKDRLSSPGTDQIQGTLSDTVECTYTPRGRGGIQPRTEEGAIFFKTLQQLSRRSRQGLPDFPGDSYRLPPLSLPTKNMRRFPPSPAQPSPPSTCSFSRRTRSASPSPSSAQHQIEEKKSVDERRSSSEEKKDRATIVESLHRGVAGDDGDAGVDSLSLVRLRCLEEEFFRRHAERLSERRRRRSEARLGREEEEDLEEKGSTEENRELVQETEGSQVYGQLPGDGAGETREERSERKRGAGLKRELRTCELARRRPLETNGQTKAEEEKEDERREKHEEEDNKKKIFIQEEALRSYLRYYTRVGIHHLELETFFHLFFEKYLHTFSLRDLEDLHTLLHFHPSPSPSSPSPSPCSPSRFSSSSFLHSGLGECAERRARASVADEEEAKEATQVVLELGEGLASCTTAGGGGRGHRGSKKKKKKESRVNSSASSSANLDFLFSLFNGTAKELPAELKRNRPLLLLLTFLYEKHPLLTQFDVSSPDP